VEQRAGQGNWLFLRYATRLQADKAVASGNGAVLPGGIMLGARRLDAASAVRMGMDGSSSLSLDLGMGTRPMSPAIGAGGSLRGLQPLKDIQHAGPADIIDDSDLLLEQPRHRRGNICQRLMRWLLS
jgi:hypothetical protein